ncbi:hypothetical protein NP233_g4161 [Leucocoprinus birnbaumii]|uniref:Uncharacterized protein n=1 Tax=Leucocoprinus birnbaumii TaxID=56174 RepID=A0AAD5YT40_9AGAR|nr:hypothetical protein NP233_g4161 [Leucocoprinus birnbaumii]
MTEPSKTTAILQELSRASVATLTTVEGTLYGLSFALYLSCSRLLLLELLKDKCCLLGLVVDTRSIQVSWVDHPSAAPGGGLIYYTSTFARTATATMGYAIGAVLHFLTFVIQIWRLSIMWRPSRYHFFITIVTSLVLLSSTVIQTLNIYDISGGQVLKGRRAVVIGSDVQQGLTLLTGLIVTSLIGARIALVRRNHIRTMESFALVFIWTAISIATSFSEGSGPRSVNIAFASLLPCIQIIAYLLVVYRVSTGRAWDKDTEEKLTSLQWNRDAQQTTQQTTTRESILILGEALEAQV